MRLGHGGMIGMAGRLEWRGPPARRELLRRGSRALEEPQVRLPACLRCMPALGKHCSLAGGGQK